MVLSRGLELDYWREGNFEVDYVLGRGKRLAAIEVKSGRGKMHASGLERFSRRSPCRKVLIGPSGLALEEALTMEADAFF